MIRGIFVLLLLASFPALACESSADCDPGSRCIHDPGQMTGVCVSALGNRTGSANSAFDPLKDPTSKACTSDVDCAYGGSCTKQAGQVHGVCAGGLSGGMHGTGPH